MIKLKNANQLVRMRNAGRIVAETLALIREHAKPGVTTLELDRMQKNILEHRVPYQRLKDIMDSRQRCVPL